MRAIIPSYTYKYSEVNGNTVHLPLSNMSRSRNFVFTINNPTPIDTLTLEELECRHIAYQEEMGANGTPHLQGCISFSTSVTLATAIRRLPVRSHVEVMRGTYQQALSYCTKEDTRISDPIQRGDPPVSQGERVDLKRYIEMIPTHSELDILSMLPETHARYYRFYDRVRGLLSKPRRHEMVIKVYWGPPGTGKSRRAADEAGDDAYYVSQPTASQTLWFDGYNTQKTVIFDDFYGWVPWSFLLRITDRYPFKVQYKGGTTEFVSTTIIFTSNTHPRDWYRNVPNGDVGPLLRRISEIVEML